MTITYFAITFFALCIALTALLTRCLITWLPRYGIVDQPSIRRSHKSITPRGGGIAIYIVFSIGFIYADYIFNYFKYSPILIPILSILSLISFYDDIKGMNALLRLFIHISVAAITLYSFLYPNLLFHGEIIEWLDFTLAVIGFAGFMNIYNFLDGIDAITSLETIHLSVTAIILTYLRGDFIFYSNIIIFISFIVGSCSIGFLIYNWSPAKIFLGDSGSITLGYLMGLCYILIAASGERLFVASAIACLYYIADGGLTLLIRLVRGEKIWLPHLNHFFQQAVRKNMDPKEVVLKISFCNLVLMILAINALFFPSISIILALLIVMCILIHFS